MRRADRIGGLFFLLLAVGTAAIALRDYPYWGPNGPGSGFLPVWLSVAMGVLAVLLLVGARRTGTPGAPWLPAGDGLRKLLIVVVATIVLVSLLPVVGMLPGAALFLVGILRFLEGYPWRRTLSIAAGTAVASYLLFIYWLKVPLPVGVLGF